MSASLVNTINYFGIQAMTFTVIRDRAGWSLTGNKRMYLKLALKVVVVAYKRVFVTVFD